jgi:hypothetical protein
MWKKNNTMRDKYKVMRVVIGLLMLLVGSGVHAIEMEITASFAPSMSNPENNIFTNTTPQSGYCATWPELCRGKFSIEIPGLSSVSSTTISARDTNKRNGLFLKIPVQNKTVAVTNLMTGDVVNLVFRPNIFGAAMNPFGGRNTWKDGGTLGFPDSGVAGCSSGAGGSYGVNGSQVRFAWSYGPGATAGCYRTSNIDRPAGITFYQYNFGYELVAPEPLTMSSGIYVGSLSYSVGPGGDFDFGDNITANDNVVNITFRLSVNHELKLSTTPEDQQVTLQPCTAGRVCTEDQGKANWERWMVSRVAPQLTGHSGFSLSSSGEFTVYLSCEQMSGADCALRSDNDGSLVPVQTLLTLPNNVVDINTRTTVVRRPLQVGKSDTQNIFTTQVFGESKKGSIDFLVAQRNVETMLTTRPDTYRGAVTVIFDPKLY